MMTRVLPWAAVVLGALAVLVMLSFPTGGLVLGMAAIAAALPSVQARAAAPGQAWVGLVLGAIAALFVIALVLFGSEPRGEPGSLSIPPPTPPGAP